MAAIDKGLADIDQQVASLLAQRAGLMSIRSRHAQHHQGFPAIAQTQARHYDAFRAELAAREADARELLRRAEVGRAAAAALVPAVDGLRDANAAEAEALRVTAHELLADAGADLAWAYRLGHSANYMLGLYAAEHCSSLARDVDARNLAFRRALREGRADVVQSLVAEIAVLEGKVAQSEAEQVALNKDTARLQHGVAPALRFLFEHNVGGSLAPGALAQARVRTSVASRALWGDDDRVISPPEEWEEEMRAEAEAGLALLCAV